MLTKLDAIKGLGMTPDDFQKKILTPNGLPNRNQYKGEEEQQLLKAISQYRAAEADTADSGTSDAGLVSGASSAADLLISQINRQTDEAALRVASAMRNAPSRFRRKLMQELQGESTSTGAAFLTAARFNASKALEASID